MYRYVQSYRSFTSEFSPVVSYIEELSRELLGYSSAELSARLAQCVVSLFLNPYICQVAAENVGEGTNVKADMRRITAKKAALLLPSGEIKVTLPGLFGRYFEFLLHWVHVLVYALSLMPGNRGKKIVESSVILFGVGEESLFQNRSDERFRRFCEAGPVTSLSGTGTLIIQSTSKHQREQDSRYIYTRFPLHYLVCNAKLGLFSRAQFLLAHLGLLLVVPVMITRTPTLSLLVKDLAYHELIKILDRKHLLSKVLFTNSSYTSQPLWARGAQFSTFSVEMIWYSQNVIPFVFRSDGEVSDMPNYHYMQLDKHWVWTQGLADYLKRLGHDGEVEVVGPILWYLPESEYKRIPDNVFRVAMFDVTPVTTEVSNRIGLPGNYYDSDTMKRFVSDVVSIFKAVSEECGVDLEVLIKPKRTTGSTHAPDYIEMLATLHSNNAHIKVMDSSTNMYEVLAQSDMAVVVPYSSPAYVANAIGIPAVFYDPVNALVPTYEHAEMISFASGAEELEAYVLRLCESLHGMSSTQVN